MEIMCSKFEARLFIKPVEFLLKGQRYTRKRADQLLNKHEKWARGRGRQAAQGRASWVWSCSLPSALSFSSSPRKDAVASQKRLRNCPECNYGSKEKGRERSCNSLPILRNSVPKEEESTGRVIRRHRLKFYYHHFWPPHPGQ